jgi:hypothetical protein
VIAVDTVTRLLTPGALRFGAPQTAGALTVVGVAHDGPAVPYLLHGEAAQGSVSFEEVGAGGVVAQLRVTNHTGQAVLLVEGQMIAGLKQTRTLNVTVLVPARSDLTIPVSCVEAGRWDPTARPAGTAAFHVSPRVRHTKTAGVQASVRAGAGYRSDQAAVWADVDERLARHRAAAPTRSYAEIHHQRGGDIHRMIERLTPEPGQRGVLALIGDRPAALDLFDRPETLAALWRSLIGSYAADALVDAASAEERHVKEAVDWVHDLAAGADDAHAAPGAGTVVQITGTTGLASALVADDAVVHLAALWRPDTDPGGSHHRMRRPSRRRAWFHEPHIPGPPMTEEGAPVT